MHKEAVAEMKKLLGKTGGRGISSTTVTVTRIKRRPKNPERKRHKDEMNTSL